MARNTRTSKAAKTSAKDKTPKEVKKEKNVRPAKGKTAAKAAVHVREERAKKARKAAPVKAEKAEKSKSKLKVMLLGGLCEIGKNLTVLEYEDDIIVIDCGLAFPDEDMLGIDLVIPDITYLEKNSEKIRGILLTHGHEDHIGAIPYVLRTINPPIYGTPLTLGILENKLDEHKLTEQAKLVTVTPGSKIKLGVFEAEFIRVNHSIPDACCIAVRTPVGVVMHTGDFKLDVSPIDGEMMDLTRIGEYGREGVVLLMCESTNVERPGFTPSERRVGSSLDQIFRSNTDKRVIVATFSSNVHRVQQIIDVSVRYGRKVAITGRSMTNVVGAAVRLGYMNVPSDTLIDISEIGRYPANRLTIITTGSQGEPMSALYRMAFSEHSMVELTSQDLVVLSSHAIPGNELLVGRIVNEMYKRGVNVYHDEAEVHVSGHACQEELKLMHALVKPKFFVPIHGEYRHLMQHKELAEFMGMSPSDIFVLNIGDVIEIGGGRCKRAGTVPCGHVLIDGYGVGDVGNIVLRDRRHLSQDGLIVVVASVDEAFGEILSGPDIISRGFVYVKESEELMEEVRRIAEETLRYAIDGGYTEWNQIKTNLKDALTKYIYSKTKRKPMILPVIMNV